jgi:hypothetical protein
MPRQDRRVVHLECALEDPHEGLGYFVNGVFWVHNYDTKTGIAYTYAGSWLDEGELSEDSLSEY